MDVSIANESAATPLAPMPRPYETVRASVGRHLVSMDLYEADGPTIVLLHGIPGWRGIWRNVAQNLAGCRIIAPDLLGFGESSEPPGDLHAAGQAEMVLGLIRRFAHGPVHLVGFDFGGPTAVLVHLQAPQLVASLTLAATNVLADTPIPGPLQLVRPPVVCDIAARLLFGRIGLSAMWMAAVARKDRFRFDQFREMLRFANGVKSTRSVFQSSLRNLPALYAPVEAALSNIRVPCRVVWGDRDPFFPMSLGGRTAALIPGAKLLRLSGCGHFLPREDPRGLANAVRELVP